MAEDVGKEDEPKLQFDSAGEAAAYISLDQARVLALQHARDNTEFYGSRYAHCELAWQVVGKEEGADYYYIRLSYRPKREFRGKPGVEQFTVDKTGRFTVGRFSSSHGRDHDPLFSHRLGR